MSNRTVSVRGITLDNLLAESGVKEVNVVKIDVEGAEKEVLIGMKQAVTNSRDIEIVFEAWDEKYVLDCRNILSSYGLVVDEEEIDKGMYLASRPVQTKIEKS